MGLVEYGLQTSQTHTYKSHDHDHQSAHLVMTCLPLRKKET